MSVLDLFAEQDPEQDPGQDSGQDSEPDLALVPPPADEILDEDALERAWGTPPFSVLRQGAGGWQKRKRAWTALGIRSHLGRSAETQNVGPAYNRTELGYAARSERAKYRAGFAAPNAVSRVPGEFEADPAWVAGVDTERALTDSTSIFDPALAELVYSWFCPRRGLVLDPFAGGSVRGIVAGMMGHPYVGIDLRPEQVEENIRQRGVIWERLSGVDHAVVPRPGPQWRAGDACDLRPIELPPVDFVFSCPPYYDLEVYSDDPADLSNLPSYERFLDEYARAIQAAAACLRDDRFAAFVVGDMREKRGKRAGLYRDFRGDTIRAFEAAGLGYYNRAVIAGPAASAALRVGTTFAKSRKLVNTHQDLLVFVKGDGRRAADQIERYERVDLGDRIDQLRLEVEG